MATAANIQVNANTSQAVGAFNNLAASIANAQRSTDQLNVSFSGSSAQAQAFAQSLAGTNTQLNRLNLSIRDSGTSSAMTVTAFSTAFEALTSFAEKLFSILSAVAGGIEMVFSSITKELDKIQGFNAMMLVSTHNAMDAAASYDFLRSTADKLGVQFDTLALNYTKLLAAIPEGTDKLNLANRAFLGIAEAARTMHASNQDTQLMFYAITQMASKGTVSMEELRRQLAEKLPGAIQIAARSVGTDVATLIQAISKGSVDSIKFLNYFSDELIRTFADSSQKASTSVSAAINRLTNVWVDFVKNILDSGSGQAIIGVFDALREKLSDTTLMAQFSALVKNLADQFQSFIAGLTREDIEKGFTQFSNFVRIMTTLIGDLIKGFTWLIDHAPQAGAILGGVAGAAAGLVAGPWGALVGGVGGAVAGAYGGRQLKGTPEEQGHDLFERMMAQQQAEQEATHRAIDQQFMVTNQLIPMLNRISGPLIDNPIRTPNPTDNPFDPSQINPIYANLFKAENLNTTEIQNLNKILTDPKFKNDAQRLTAVEELSRTGQVLYPNASGIGDVLNGKQKLTAHERSLNATEERAYGLNAEYPEQIANLNELYKTGRLNLDAYNKGVQDLVAKQPVEIAYAKELAAEQKQYNDGMELFISQAIKSVEAKEKINLQLSDEIRMAGMRSEDLKIETEVTKLRNQAIKEGVQHVDELEHGWEAMIRTRNKLNELEKIGESIEAQTVDKYAQQLLQQQAMDRMVQQTKDGKNVFQKSDQTAFTVNQDPNMHGSKQWIDAQKKQLDDYYAWIDGLRKNDVISEATAAQAKAMADQTYQQIRINQTESTFSILATLSTSGNKTLAQIGKDAALVTATIDGYVAIQKAIAAPPGWPYNAGNVAAVTIVQAANVAAIASQAGFMDGGWTGDGPVDAPAGVVHGQEFVVNASAAAKNRASLEAMNRGDNYGAARQMSNGRSPAQPIKFEVHNLGTPQSYSGEQLDASTVRLIAEDVVARKAPGAVAKTMNNPNSAMSKSIRNNTTAGRKRS